MLEDARRKLENWRRDQKETYLLGFFKSGLVLSARAFEAICLFGPRAALEFEGLKRLCLAIHLGR